MSLDESIGRLGLAILKSPLGSPKVNAMGEPVIGTIRGRCGCVVHLDAGFTLLFPFLLTCINTANASRRTMAQV